MGRHRTGRDHSAKRGQLPRPILMCAGMLIVIGVVCGSLSLAARTPAAQQTLVAASEGTREPAQAIIADAAAARSQSLEQRELLTTIYRDSLLSAGVLMALACGTVAIRNRRSARLS